jgi:hypothetical protein
MRQVTIEWAEGAFAQDIAVAGRLEYDQGHRQALQ